MLWGKGVRVERQLHVYPFCSSRERRRKRESGYTKMQWSNFVYNRTNGC